MLTDRLVEIDRQIKTLAEEKKEIEARLDAYALKQPQESLKDTAREGRKVTLSGTRFRLPVIFTSDLLLKSFKEGSQKHKELVFILEDNGEPRDRLGLFFSPPSTWETRFKDGLEFRAKVAEHLPKEVASRFISACTQVDKHGVKKSTRAFDYQAAAEAGKEAE